MICNVIASGSNGNATVLNNEILIDCGISFKALRKVYKTLKIVCLTHTHKDHFNKTTIAILANERPTLRFACCEWLVKDLIICGVRLSNIDVLKIGSIYNYKSFKISAFKLYHDVKNCGYRIYIGDKRCIYATDTSTLQGISAINYDLYLIESNFEEIEIKKKIKEKEKNNEFIYEYRVLKTHLSKQKCDKFLYENMGEKSKYIYMHQHKECEVVENE